ncbi:hypothetical protein K488DRAFT_88147 [Vararia minispora EC-137]|uniref:Uncharacterized protein n=1 Tax=Vararia minispora EC-137 TaxID=1314806 RepID=A0ACB8QEM1_9AGAM|nr:hypothetical protein K488DRAFT_88147 [Vararia minispora EC-137]
MHDHRPSPSSLDNRASASSSSQPIALPSHHPQDVHMASPSSFAGGHFNPASYTRALFGGSPISWRASFGANHVYPGSSPGAQLFGSFDPSSAKLSSSIESDRAVFLSSQDELCRNYTCCGLNLPDLHALVEHFEEAHVLVLDPSQSHNSSLLPNALPHMHAVYAQQLQPQHQLAHPQVPTQQLSAPVQHPSAYYPSVPAPAVASFDPADDMELDVEASPASSSASSPPHTPPYVPAIQTQIPYVPPPYSTLSSQPSSACPSPVSAFDTTAVLPSRTKQAFNAYPAFSAIHDGVEPQPELAVAPAMLFGNSQQHQQGTTQGVRQQHQAALAAAAQPQLNAAVTAAASRAKPSSGSSRSAAPSAAPSPPSSSASTPAPGSPAGKETPRASTTLSRPASSLLLSKPFRCPKPGCSKSYKQANGLKYHMTHGSCSFAPPKDLQALQALLAEKGLDGTGTLSESDAREVEREAEQRLRPFACAVGDCTRRYKNMNGLRYHYQHSGEHGAEGLRLLASGQHECLQHHTGRGGKPRAGSTQVTVSQASPAPTPAPSPTQGGQQWYGQQYAWQQQQAQQQQHPAQPAVHI